MKVTTSQLDITNESQEVSSFPSSVLDEGREEKGIQKTLKAGHHRNSCVLYKVIFVSIFIMIFLLLIKSM